MEEKLNSKDLMNERLSVGVIRDSIWLGMP